MELLTAQTQRNLSYFWFIGFFGLMFLRGLGFIDKEALPNDLYTLTAMLITFWFSRNRELGDSKREELKDEKDRTVK